MKFTILTPTKDRPEFIGRALASVVNQSHPDWELIVNDVGERSIIRLLPDDDRIRYLRGRARGPARDFQRCLDFATGEVVTPLSDDDQLHPKALEIVAANLGEADWLVAGTILEANDRVVAFRGGTEESVDQTLAGQFMLGGAVYWRRSLSDELGGFDERFDGAADFDLYARFARHVRPKVIPEVLYVYTDHAGTDTRLRMEVQSQRSVEIARRLEERR